MWWLLWALGARGLLEDGWMEGPAAKTADRLAAARAGESHWLVKVLKAYDGRSAVEAT
jgi:hypothetical protein